MLYLDTSPLVSAVSSEEATARVHDWLAQQADNLAISDWTVLEFASAAAAKQRNGEITATDRSHALTWFEQFRDGTAELWAVRTTAFRRATELINVVGVKVRAADALHLAIAEEHGATLCTLDKEQAEAGEAAGISTRLL